ncbi:uncharacterized protein B0J16DRAFT_402152 [Fusarium flagelliforme]|uniref:uncharacterized protein n=1 Tax=Fusarium flagelliforme TaxID=2675880 RepID=UPI001E8E8D15|nr:uncharacterized protein B0J16DRAFT_402152 [Fusarium flagelliforme]KAH7183621.1 hypothetical protein B0J16DRAFT_402152 [Fusarium flagelliforme]
MRAYLNRNHGFLAVLTIVIRLADAAGLAMFTKGALAGSELPSDCETTLYQTVSCPEEVSDLMTDGYIDSDDPAVTKRVCSKTCGGSIGHMRSKVASACGSREMIPGMAYVNLVDKLWSGWNQSCFSDPKTGKYCNDVIASFPQVDDISELPKSDLCSYCNVEKYRMMQADAYTGAYDEYSQASYEYVAKACDINVDNFNATDSAFNVTNPGVEEDTCVTGKTYSAKDGDSCDSIAVAEGVSAATLYYINSNIFDCKRIAAGTNLCLPLTCTQLYKVKKGDTCVDIAINANILTDRLLSFNPQIDSNCTNLYDADPYWGSTLCVSTPGGTYSGQPVDDSQPTDPEPVDPPSGAPVANGTTKQCSHWFTHDDSLSCAQICLAYKIPVNLFTEINPSLNKTTCDTDLVAGNAYCLEPVAGWYQPTPTVTTTPGATVSRSAMGTKSATATNSATHTSGNEPSHSPEQPGIVDGCSKWHYVDDGDGCYSIAEKYKIELTDFYSWNPNVGDGCTGLWLHYYICVGVES